MKRFTMFLAVMLALALPVFALAQQSGNSGSTTPPATNDNSASMNTGSSTTAPAAEHHASSHKSSKAPKAPKIDLNTASKDDLMKVPGMTSDTADKIIAARPFKSKGELESKKIVTKTEYNKMASHFVVHTEKAAKTEKTEKSEKMEKSEGTTK
jgi:competence protein ComEA